ncbi:ABC transporter ATP-binding protein YtrB [Thalassocella blandensis]|nr:ABC transporter ATP-binding protein YtrB [Thalassocella blandensis]
MNKDGSLISMSGVAKRYEHFTMENFNLQLSSGEVLGLIGPNGAGKTTCLRLIMGFISADQGDIEVLGKSVKHDIVSIKQDVAYVAEDMRMFGNKTIQWHMQFFSSLFVNWDQPYATELLETFQLIPQQQVKTLSLGQRIKTSLLLALARRPRILVLDEPSTGLDPVARHELTSQLFQIMLNEDHSVIFSSQFTQDVERLSDRIVFIDDGQIISNQDKESYLDSWKRIDVCLEAEKDLKAFSDIKEVQKNALNMSVIHSEFNSEIQKRYSQLGYSIEISKLTLEEIFIAQTLHRRQHLSAKGINA